jgi:hypothetical protein
VIVWDYFPSASPCQKSFEMYRKKAEKRELLLNTKSTFFCF